MLIIDCVGLHGVDHLCSCLGNYLFLFFIVLMLKAYRGMFLAERFSQSDSVS